MAPVSGHVTEIDPRDSRTWMGKWFVTIDIDWAHDEVLDYALGIVEESGIRATWLATHRTKILDRIAGNPNFELGIHPNFNPLLGPEPHLSPNAIAVIEDCLDFVPGARVLRSHSLTHSSRLSDMFSSLGITHDLNCYIPFGAARELAPWHSPIGHVRVPFGWEDDLEMPIRGIPTWDNLGGLRVLDFHPIHLFLNTEELSRYEDSRPIHQSPELLRDIVNSGLGARSVFESLVAHLTS